jgi:hypothetical protein
MQGLLDAAIEALREIGNAPPGEFTVGSHVPEWLPSGVCAVCGEIRVNDLGGQDPYPRFGADEYLMQ